MSQWTKMRVEGVRFDIGCRDKKDFSLLFHLVHVFRICGFKSGFSHSVQLWAWREATTVCILSDPTTFSQASVCICRVPIFGRRSSARPRGILTSSTRSHAIFSCLPFQILFHCAPSVLLTACAENSTAGFLSDNQNTHTACVCRHPCRRCRPSFERNVGVSLPVIRFVLHFAPRGRATKGLPMANNGPGRLCLWRRSIQSKPQRCKAGETVHRPVRARCPFI